MNLSATHVLACLLLAATACGGNYSNEDLEFQAALPAREEVVTAFPQALVVADAAEYQVSTRALARALDTAADGLLNLIDGIRSFTPTRRDGAIRVWGPYDDEKKPGWQSQMTMEREGATTPDAPAISFKYRIDIRRKTGPASFTTLVSGRYSPRGGARVGEGELVLDTTAARAIDYPLPDMENLARFEVTYQTLTAPTTSTIKLLNVPADDMTPTLTYTREGNAGALSFDGPIEKAKQSVIAQALRLDARWLAGGEGRADVSIRPGLFGAVRATDCWGTDTRATFVRRDWDHSLDRGSEATCVLPAP